MDQKEIEPAEKILPVMLPFCSIYMWIPLCEGVSEHELLPRVLVKFNLQLLKSLFFLLRKKKKKERKKRRKENPILTTFLFKLKKKKKSQLCFLLLKAWQFSCIALSGSLSFHSASFLITDYSFMDGQL